MTFPIEQPFSVRFWDFVVVVVVGWLFFWFVFLFVCVWSFLGGSYFGVGCLVLALFWGFWLVGFEFFLFIGGSSQLLHMWKRSLK